MEDDFDTDLNSEPPEASPSKGDVITADGEEGIITDDVIPDDTKDVESDVKASDAVDVTPAESGDVMPEGADAKVADSDNITEGIANEVKSADQDEDSKVGTGDSNNPKLVEPDDETMTEDENVGKYNAENNDSAKLGMYNWLTRNHQ